jgi:hypothetical protein
MREEEEIDMAMGDRFIDEEQYQQALDRRRMAEGAMLREKSEAIGDQRGAVEEYRQDTNKAYQDWRDLPGNDTLNKIVSIASAAALIGAGVAGKGKTANTLGTIGSLGAGFVSGRQSARKEQKDRNLKAGQATAKTNLAASEMDSELEQTMAELKAAGVPVPQDPVERAKAYAALEYKLGQVETEKAQADRERSAAYENRQQGAAAKALAEQRRTGDDGQAERQLTDAEWRQLANDELGTEERRLQDKVGMMMRRYDPEKFDELAQNERLNLGDPVNIMRSVGNLYGGDTLDTNYPGVRASVDTLRTVRGRSEADQIERMKAERWAEKEINNWSLLKKKASMGDQRSQKIIEDLIETAIRDRPWEKE